MSHKGENMIIPKIDKYVDEVAKKVDATGYIQEVKGILEKAGFQDAQQKAYAFAVLELWQKATKVNWIKPYADIVALKPYVTMVEELQKQIEKSGE